MLEQTEVATASTLPRIVTYSPLGSSGDRVTCTFQDNQAFYLGGVRANYLCDPTWFLDRERAGAYTRAEGDEVWILAACTTRALAGSCRAGAS
jgi:hypothetical protein